MLVEENAVPWQSIQSAQTKKPDCLNGFCWSKKLFLQTCVTKTDCASFMSSSFFQMIIFTRRFTLHLLVRLILCQLVINVDLAVLLSKLSFGKVLYHPIL